MTGNNLLDQSGPRPHGAGDEESLHGRASSSARPVVAILQSNYIPWKGYFDLIASADVFILYDIVQYTKNDWRNRNRIRTPGGTEWLTIPVVTAGRFGQPINEVEVSDARWTKKHWRALEGSYGRAPAFGEFSGPVRTLYERAADEKLLSGINEIFLRGIADLMGLPARIVRASAEGLPEDRVSRLVALCRLHGGRCYLSGPSAKTYIDETMFRDAGIGVTWMDYRGYREYRQSWAPPFIHEVSIVDLLFAEGRGARRFLQSGRET